MPPVTPLLATLRIVGGLGLVVGVAAFGYFARPLWVLPVLAAIFTVSFGLGKWRAWGHAAQTGTLPKAVLAQGGTYVVQLVVVALFYFIGRGVGSLAGVENGGPIAGQKDWASLGWFAAFALALGLGIMGLEKGAAAHAQSPAPEAPGAQTEPSDTIETIGPYLDPTPLTPQTFWTRHHYSNKDNAPEGSTEKVVNPDRAFLDDAAIAAEEARLGVSLPASLRALYAMQNGGSGMSLYVPCPLDLNNKEDGWINPFSGYNDMTPLTRVETLYDRISAYAYDDQTEMFPPDSKRMIVLAQWYRETLFLDYRGGANPRVGFADFDDHEDLSTGDWEQKALWWDDFDAFFADLRKQTPED